MHTLLGQICKGKLIRQVPKIKHKIAVTLDPKVMRQNVGPVPEMKSTSIDVSILK